MIKTIINAVFTALIAFFMSFGATAFAANSSATFDRPIRLTAVGIQTRDSVGLTTETNRCRIGRDLGSYVQYGPDCFGFPEEKSSDIFFGSRGQIIRISVEMDDSPSIREFVDALRIVKGDTAKKEDGYTTYAWTVNFERWVFEEMPDGRWNFTREVRGLNRADTAEEHTF